MKVTNVFGVGCSQFYCPHRCSRDVGRRGAISRTSVIEEATDRAIVDFGEVPVGLRVTKVFQITNDGDQPVSIERLALLPQTALFELEHDLEQVGPGDDELVIHFKPAEVVNYSAKLHVLYAEEAGPLGELQIFGSGVKTPFAPAVKEPKLIASTLIRAFRCEHLGGCEEDHIVCTRWFPRQVNAVARLSRANVRRAPKRKSPPLRTQPNARLFGKGMSNTNGWAVCQGKRATSKTELAHGNSLIGNLQDAIDYWENLEFAGHNDWVLPTIDQQKVLFTVATACH